MSLMARYYDSVADTSQSSHYAAMAHSLAKFVCVHVCVHACVCARMCVRVCVVMTKTNEFIINYKTAPSVSKEKHHIQNNGVLCYGT